MILQKIGLDSKSKNYHFDRYDDLSLDVRRPTVLVSSCICSICMRLGNELLEVRHQMHEVWHGIRSLTYYTQREIGFGQIENYFKKSASQADFWMHSHHPNVLPRESGCTPISPKA